MVLAGIDVFVAEQDFVALTAVKDTNDRDLTAVDFKRYCDAAAIAQNSQTRANVFAENASVWQRLQFFAIIDNPVRVLSGDIWRRRPCNVAVELCKLLLGFWREDYRVLHYKLLVALLCSAVRRSRT